MIIRNNKLAASTAHSVGANLLTPRNVVMTICLAGFVVLHAGCDSAQETTSQASKKKGSENTDNGTVSDELDGLIAKAEGLLLSARELNDGDLASSLTLTVAKLKQLRTETDPPKMIRIMAAITVEIQSFDSSISSRMKDAESRIAKLEDHYHSLEEAIEGLRRNFNATISALEVRLGNRIDQLSENTQQQVEQLKSHYESLEGKFRQMDETLKRLDSLGLSDLKTQWEANRRIFSDFIAQTNVEIEDAKKRIGSLESDYSKQATDITALKLTDQETARRMDLLQESFAPMLNDLRAEMIQRQDQKIAALQDQFQSLSATVSDLVKTAEQLKDLKTMVSELASQAQSMRGEVDILNLAKDRSEVLAAITSRMEVALAWAALRTSHVDKVFCKGATNKALSMFDYRAAHEASAFCADKLAVLRDASITIQTVKGILQNIAAANINDRCDQEFTTRPGAASEPAEFISDSDLASSSELRSQIIQYCQSGPVRVRALIIESLTRLDAFPEYRTIQELRKMAPAARKFLIGNLAKFPESFDPMTLSLTPTISPLSPELIQTPYGKIERVFRENFITKKYRLPGQPEIFPPTPAQIGSNPSDAVFTRSEISSDPGLVAVKDTEVTPCAAVAARTGATNTLSLRKSPHSLCFPYPADPAPACPVNDDIVLPLDPSNPSGQAYVYEIFYQGLNEIIRPKMINGRHAMIGSGGSSLSVRRVLGNANLPRSYWISVTTPYGSLGPTYSHCQKFTMIEMLEHGAWIHPGEKDASGAKISDGKSGFDRYLNGFDWSGPNEITVNPVFPSVVNNVTLPTKLQARYLNSIAHSRSMPLAFYYDITRPVPPFDVVKSARFWPTIDLAAFKAPTIAGSRSMDAIGRIGIGPVGKILSQLTGDRYWGQGTLYFFGKGYTFGAAKPLYANTTTGSFGALYVREQELASRVDVMDGVACDSVKIANPFSVDVSGRKVIFDKAKYHLFEGYGGRCTIDLAACAAFKGQTIASKSENFYQGHLNIGVPDASGSMIEMKGDRCEIK